MNNLKKGFTLIELLIVVAIIGILSVTLAPKLSSSLKKTKVAKVKSKLSTTQIKLTMNSLLEEYPDLKGAIETSDNQLLNKYAVESTSGFTNKDGVSYPKSNKIVSTRDNTGGWHYIKEDGKFYANLPNGAYTGDTTYEIWDISRENIVVENNNEEEENGDNETSDNEENNGNGEIKYSGNVEEYSDQKDRKRGDRNNNIVVLKGDGGTKRTGDSYDGRGGIDTSVYSGNFEDYDITFGSTLVTVIDEREDAPDGRDRLKSVEILQFRNGQLIFTKDSGGNVKIDKFVPNAMTEGVDY